MGKFWSGFRQNLGKWLYAIGIAMMDETGERIRRLLKRSEETLGIADDEIHLIMEHKNDGNLIVHSYIGERKLAAKYIRSLEGKIVLAKTLEELRGLIIAEAAFPEHEVPEKAKWVR